MTLPASILDNPAELMAKNDRLQETAKGVK